MVGLRDGRVLWGQVLGLAGVQGAISLAWVVYGLYLPQLLGQLGLPVQLATVLFVLESGLAIAIEPLMGMASDRLRRWMGNQFPLVALGAILAALLFMGMPLVAAFGGVGARGLLIAVILAWAIAMAMFRSPVLALLGRYATASNLPQAASLLTLAGVLTGGATATFANQFILSLGAGAAFAISSLVLLGAVGLLRFLNPRVELPVRAIAPSQQPFLPSLLVIIGSVGLSVAVGTTLVKKVLNLAALGANPALLTGLFVVAHALTVVPAGWFASRFGNRRAMVLGLVAMAGLAVLTGVVPGIAIATSILMGIAFSFSVNGTLPMVLTFVPPDKAGLGTGIYFAGSALASVLLGAATSLIDQWSMTTSALVGALVLLIAGGCVIVGDRASKI